LKGYDDAAADLYADQYMMFLAALNDPMKAEEFAELGVAGDMFSIAATIEIARGKDFKTASRLALEVADRNTLTREAIAERIESVFGKDHDSAIEIAGQRMMSIMMMKTSALGSFLSLVRII
jgi:hypothetical protein